jgi:hypothetical protein
LAHLFSRFSQTMKSKLLSNEEKERKCTISESVDCIYAYAYILASNIVLFALVAGSTEPANCGLATMVIVDLTANEIYIMMKKLGQISVFLYCWYVPCVRQITSKRGRGSTTTSCC